MLLPFVFKRDTQNPRLYYATVPGVGRDVTINFLCGSTCKINKFLNLDNWTSVIIIVSHVALYAAQSYIN